MGNVTVNGEAAALGDVVAIYVGNELRVKRISLIHRHLAVWLG